MATRVSHPIFARVYPRIERFAQAHGARAHREELLYGLGRRVLEVGAGTGANFPFYPESIEQFVAVEPEPRLRAQAERAARGLPFPVDVLSGTAEELLLPDNAFDVVVSSLVLCSVRDVDRAVAEMRRVLKPGGELRFYEHVCAERPKFARLQRTLDVLWPVLFGGCHLARDPESAMIRAGLRMEAVRRFDFTINGRMNPSSPCVIGRAVKT